MTWITACLGCPTAAGAQGQLPVHFDAAVTPSPARPNEIVTATVHVSIDDGWHVYSVEPPAASPGPAPSAITQLGAYAAMGPTTEDAPTRTHDPNFDMDVAFHVRAATFQRQFQVAGGAPAPDAVVFHYQTCNNTVCRPPTDVTIPVQIAVEAGPVRPQYAHATAPTQNVAGTPPLPSSQAGREKATGFHPLAGGLRGVSGAPVPLGLFLLAAIGAGLLSLLTPCVFPLIPITLTSFAKQAEGDRRRLVRLATGYAGGIIALYVLVGAVVAATLGATGANKLAANPWVNLFEFALFVVFALSFFETITLKLPDSLSGLQSAARKRSGSVGLMLMGVAFVLASFTCTAPFVGTLLVSAAGGQKLRPLLGMFAFAVAFTSPFLLCAAFPHWIGRIPKGGVWLARVKATLGFIELAAATKFLSNADQVWQWKLLTQPVLLGIWALTFFCAFLYLIDLLRFGIVAEVETGPRGPVPPARGAFASLFLAITIYCFWGLAGRPLAPIMGAFLPPAGYGGVGGGSDTNTLPWLSDYKLALAQAKTEGKPLLIDFTGYTCTNCRFNEKNVFPRPDVQQDLANFVRVQLYTDGGADGPANQQFQETKFGDVTLPLYGVIDPGSDSVVDKIGGVVTASTFKQFLATSETKVAVAAQPSNPPLLSKERAVVRSLWAPFDPSQIGKGSPVLVDFTAQWCTNCHAIEKKVFENPSVKPILASEFVTMRADMTNWDAAPNHALEQQYGIDALPAVLLFDPAGHELRAQRITGQLGVQEFLARIASLRRG